MNNGQLFHWKNNIYFGRRRDDSVRILQLPPDARPTWVGLWPVNADDDLEKTNHPPLIDLTIDADSWASIIASVSEGGEMDERWYAARDFHNSKGKIHVVPEAGKGEGE